MNDPPWSVDANAEHLEPPAVGKLYNVARAHSGAAWRIRASGRRYPPCTAFFSQNRQKILTGRRKGLSASVPFAKMQHRHR